MDCSPPGSSVHRISQAKILEWVAISFSKPPLDCSVKGAIYIIKVSYGTAADLLTESSHWSVIGCWPPEGGAQSWMRQLIADGTIPQDVDDWGLLAHSTPRSWDLESLSKGDLGNASQSLTLLFQILSPCRLSSQSSNFFKYLPQIHLVHSFQINVTCPQTLHSFPKAFLYFWFVTLAQHYLSLWVSLILHLCWCSLSNFPPWF